MISIFLLLAFAILLLLYSIKKAREIKLVKKKYNIEDGEIVYTDLDKPAKPLFSKQLNLVGKPDYIVKQSRN